MYSDIWLLCLLVSYSTHNLFANDYECMGVECGTHNLLTVMSVCETCPHLHRQPHLTDMFLFIFKGL